MPPRPAASSDAATGYLSKIGRAIWMYARRPCPTRAMAATIAVAGSGRAAAGSGFVCRSDRRPGFPTRRDAQRLDALLHGDEVATLAAEINLPRAEDLLILVLEHLVPLREPAGRPRD